jgi:uncharacterized protein YndB with AHSA1/START domain
MPKPEFGTPALASFHRDGAPGSGRSDGTVSDAGKVVECDPPRRLAYTFVNLSDKYQNEFPALATFVLEPHGKLVKLTLTHEGFVGGQQVPGRHLEGMARHPVQSQEHAGNRQAAGDPHPLAVITRESG